MQSKNQTDATRDTVEPSLDIELSKFTARRKKCDVCGRGLDAGITCMKLTSTVDKDFLLMDMECYMYRNSHVIRKELNAALERRFPNLTKYWREQNEKGNNQDNQDNNNDQEA
jgi:hypothetical protein